MTNQGKSVAVERKSVLVERLRDQADAAVRRGSPREAVSLYKKVLEYRPYDAEACEFLALYHEHRAEYREAGGYLARLNRGHGPDPDLVLTIAKFAVLADDLERAIAAFEDLRSLSRHDRSARGKEYKKFAEWQIDMLKRQIHLDKIFVSSPKQTPVAREGRLPRPAAQRRESRSGAGRLCRTSASASNGATSARKARQHEPPQAARPEAVPARRLREETVGLSVSLPESHWPASFASQPDSPLLAYRLRLDFYRLTLLRGYDELICLNHLPGVERFWYQIETVKKVLRDFGGRVLLGDEVGLGKTIEACMAAKEFMLRGLVRSVLILTPASLVSQWQEELASKFALSFTTTDEVTPARHPEFWQAERIIASINLAKSNAHRERLLSRAYDLVIVDEAHHLKNRATLSWKLVNELKSKYLFLLSATPVQNDLIELFNLITLLKPGTLKTEAVFKKEYVKRGSPQEPANPDRLRELLRSVMIRNTRSLVDIKLPKRFAHTLVVDPLPVERQVYDLISELVRNGGTDGDPPANKTLLTTLLREAGSSPFALEATLARHGSENTRSVLELLRQVGDTAKSLRLLELLRENPREKTIVFSQYLKTLDYLARLLDAHGVRCATYHGGLSNPEKEDSIRRFREEVPVLLATESGGEGHNMQFANTLVNYDLPWNPMRIEQRIGRLHRVGQSRDVFIFNLCLRDTVEHYLLDVLEKKINMFELVIGEIDMIVGNLDDEKEFSSIVFDLWKEATNHTEARARFDELGERLVRAKTQYQEATRLDEVLFHEDFEV